MIYSLTLTGIYTMAFTLTASPTNSNLLIATQGGSEAGMLPAGSGLNANFKYIGTILSGLISVSGSGGGGGSGSTSGVTYTAIGNISVGSGIAIGANSKYCMFEGVSNTANASTIGSHVEGQGNTLAGNYGHAEGYNQSIYGLYNHGEGNNQLITGTGNHCEGNNNTAGSTYSHVEGWLNTVPVGADYSHAEGYYNYVSGQYSHGEGTNNVMSPTVVAGHVE